MQVVANGEVELLETNEKEMTQGRFGQDILQAMMKHKAGEAHMLSQRVELLHCFMRDMAKQAIICPPSHSHSHFVLLTVGTLYLLRLVFVRVCATFHRSMMMNFFCL